MIFERPMRTLPPEAVGPLVEGVNEIRSQGAAVIWLAGGEYEAKQVFSGNVVHYESVQGKLIAPVTEGSR